MTKDNTSKSIVTGNPGKDWLDEPVTIHFTEDSIPGLRSGVLTEEAKAAIAKHEAEAVREAKLELIKDLYWEISSHEGHYVKTLALNLLSQKEMELKADLKGSSDE